MDIQEQCRYLEAFELAHDRYDYYLNILGDPFEAFFRVKELFQETNDTWKRHNCSGYSIDSYAEGYYAGMARILTHLQLDARKSKEVSRDESDKSA
jgi:hypothetical protein